MRRYKNMDWQREYKRSKNRLRSAGNMPTSMLTDEARVLLRSHYGGPWKMVLGLLKYEIKKAWEHYRFMWSERERVRVFKRIPSPALEIAERVLDEEKSPAEMAREL